MNNVLNTLVQFVGPKRLRKQVKYLSNFVLYTMHKKLAFSKRMEEIQVQAKTFEELKEKSAHILESVNKVATHKAKQLTLIEKVVLYSHL